MFDIEQDDIPEYIATIPVISQEMEIELDRIINGLAAEFGFETTQQFAQSIIDGELPPDMLVIYDDIIGKVIEKYRT